MSGVVLIVEMIRQAQFKINFSAHAFSNIGSIAVEQKDVGPITTTVKKNISVSVIEKTWRSIVKTSNQSFKTNEPHVSITFGW